MLFCNAFTIPLSGQSSQFCSAGRTPLGLQLALSSPKCSGQASSPTRRIASTIQCKHLFLICRQLTFAFLFCSNLLVVFLFQRPNILSGIVRRKLDLPRARQTACAELAEVLRIVNNVRTVIQQQNEYIYIPDLREYANA